MGEASDGSISLSEQKIIDQIENYFINSEYLRDEAIEIEMNENSNWLSLETLIKSGQFRDLTTDIDEIIGVLRKSSRGIVEVDEKTKKIRYLKSNRNQATIVKAISIGNQNESTSNQSEKRLIPTVLTMRVVSKPSTDPPPPILKGYMLIRNADGGYYLISTTDTTSDDSTKHTIPTTFDEEMPELERISAEVTTTAKNLSSSINNGSRKFFTTNLDEEIKWITDAILSMKDRRGTKMEICDWIEKNVSNLKSNWKTNINRTLSSRRNIFQRIIKRIDDGTNQETYYTVAYVSGRPGVMALSTKVKLLQPRPGGRYRAILPKGGGQPIIVQQPKNDVVAIKSTNVGGKSNGTISNGKSVKDGIVKTSNIGRISGDKMSNKLPNDEETYPITGMDAAAFVLMTGLDSAIFNCLLKDMEAKLSSIWKFRRTLQSRDCLLFILLWLRHDPKPEQLRRWFVGDDQIEKGVKSKYQRDQQWLQIRRSPEQLLPFLAMWIKDFIVWSDPLNEHLPTKLKDLLSSVERLRDPKNVIGILDPLIISVKKDKDDECCQCVAIFIIVYNFEGAISYRSPIFWADCPIKRPKLFENGLKSAILSCYRRDLSRLLESDQILLIYNKDIKNEEHLPESIRLIKSKMISNLLKEKFDQRLKNRFRILSTSVASDGNLLRVSGLMDIVTVCAGIANLMSPIIWVEDKD